MIRVLLIIILLSVIAMANNEKTIDISKTFWYEGYVSEEQHDYVNAYKNYIVAANQINVPNKPKDFDANYILWSIEAIHRILKENPELSTIKNELDYWDFKLINSKYVSFQKDLALIRIYGKAQSYEVTSDYSNAYKYYAIVAKQIDTLDGAKKSFADDSILLSIKNIRQIIEKNPSLSIIKNEIEYWNLKLKNSKSEEARNMDISDNWSKGYDFEKKQDYRNAYKYYKIAATSGHQMSITSLAKILEKNPELSTKENEIEFWLLEAVENDPSNDENFAISFLEKYYRDTNQTEKQKFFTKEMYEKYNNLQMGCTLSNYYNSNGEYIKSFDLAKKIYENNEQLPIFNNCVSLLGYSYSNGKNGIAKNINKAIELQIEYFNQKKEDYLTAVSIADLYLKEKKDYENAQKWYEVAYNIKKDEQHLTKVEEYKKKQPIYALEKKTNQELFPVINNPLLEKNILASSGNKEYNFFATPNKDIKMFDGNTLKFVRSFRGWIGEGLNGLTTSMAVDEVNNLLYATGINSFEDYSKNEIIKIFDIATGKITKTLNNENSSTFSKIIISNDGKYLVTINDNGNSFNIIDTKSNYLLSFKKISTNYLYGIIKKENNDYFIHILDKDNFINIFSLNKERLIERKQFEGEISFYEKKILLKKRNNTYEVFDYNYKLLHTKENIALGNVSLSEDCSKLLVASHNIVEIFDLDTLEVIRKLKFNNKIIKSYLDSLGNLYYVAEDKLSLVNLDSNLTHEYQIEKDNKLKYIYRLNDTQLNISYENNDFTFDSIKLELLSSDTKLSKNHNDIKSKISYKLNDNRMIEIYNDKNMLFKINLYLSSIQKVQIIDEKFIWVDIGFVLIYNLKGELIGQIDTLQTIQNNFYTYQNKLYTYGDDNIVHIWDINDLNKIKISKEEVFDQEILKSFYKLYKTNVLERLNTLIADFVKEEAERNKWSITPTKEEYIQSFKALLIKKEKIKPTASLYIKNEQDWILYTPEGLFTYGGEGYKLLKYHQNQGLYKEAKIIENEKLFDKFYRPDLIKKILVGEKIDIPMDVKAVILNIKPPELQILSNQMISERDIDLIYKVCDAGNGVADPKLLINGQAINPPSSRVFSEQKIDSPNDKCKIYKSSHTLDPGANKISFKAYDQDKNIANESEPIVIDANYSLAKKDILDLVSNNDIEKTSMINSELYLVNIAVSDYEDESFDLKYSVKDALAIKDKFIKKNKKRFKQIHTFDLYDTNVTQENIDNVFNDIAKKIKYNDSFVLYIAGHGTSRDGRYQFIPHKITEKISIDSLKDNLSKVAVNKSLVLLDTCQSGAAIEKIDDTATKNRLAYDSAKINYIVASSKDQVALEGLENHGVFTYAVLDGFEKAYFADESDLLVHNLGRYIQNTVPQLTKKHFRFEQEAQFKMANDFVLGGKN